MDTGEDRPAKVRRLGGDGAAPEEVAARAPGRVTVVEQDGKSCMHQVMVPDEWTGELGPPAARPGPAAKEYPFQIDPFQQTSINCLEAGHSVLVAAHTSAGKTVVAQYAIAMALRDKSRVVYTSPLKALSNQKYREFFEEFGDVGLITGDVMINPNASCLVMTTEILRSMLYSGSDVVSEVQLVVYDEIHYMRDKERGVVWEESLILLPPACQMAFLSATLPNAQDFAQWIANLHKRACHVVSTDFRPTPLVHYLFPCGAEQLYMVVDQRSNFNEANFSKAVAALSDSGTAGGGHTGKKGAKDTGAGEQSDMLKIVRMILSRQLQPAIVFSFSKKDCEALAMQMQTLDLTSEEEKKNVDLIYRAAMDSLSIQDRRLPQIVHLLPVLRRGVGLHHSGLLPIVKEVIEILFQEGLLKVLFATETFSTGLNMPARTVVFANVRKFDGGTFRWISSGEYVQMSGRAGRRGLDDKGVVILMLDTKMEPAVAKNMLRGQPDPLHSEFHLSYNMLLSMLRHPGPLAGPEELMQRSFRQFQAQAELPTLQKRADDLLAEHNAVEVPEEEQVIQYLLLLQQLQAVQDEIRGVLTQPKYALPFLQPGRLVKLVQPPDGCAEAARSRGGEGAESSGNVPATAEACVLPGTVWAVVVNFERRETASARNGTAHETDSHGGDGSGDAYTVDVLASVWKDEGGAAGGGVVRSRMAQLASQQESPASTTAKVVGVPLAAVQAMSTARIYLHKDLRAQEHRQAAIKCLAEAVHRLERKQGAVPLLDPVRDMKVECGRYRKAAKKAAKIRQLLGSHPLHNNPQLPAWLRKLQGKQDLATAVRAARREVKAAKGLILKDDLKHRRRCLRRLGFVDEDGVVTLKGRVACELQSCDELVLAELLLGGMFQTWGPATIVAVISTFIWQEKVGSGAALSEEMQRALASIRDVARRIGKVQEEAGMAVELDAYVQSFSSDLMPVAAAWAEGAAFADIVKQTDVFEGSLVRAVRRLEEVLRQMVSAAQVVGDDALASKFTTCIERVKRDIVFAASLYL